MENLQKIIGWVLLATGLAVIFWTAYYSFNVFTSRAAVPEIFKAQEKIQPSGATGKTPATQAELQKQMENLIAEQLKGMLPPDALPKLLNLISWSILAGILILAGSQAAGIGIKLIKK